jgi:hypothetical protein
MSQMLADIRRIVNEDVSNRVTQYEVIYEAITNSIHANATHIICTLDSFDNLLKMDEDETTPRKVDSISVWDNGDGINASNYASFCKYRTEHKLDLGCKGVGRFIFLKTFKHIEYLSRLVKEQEEKSFKFEFEFDTDNIKIVPQEVESNSTTITLKDPTLLHLYPERGIERRISLDVYEIREKVLLHLIPTLFFYKKKKKRKIKIDFVDSKNNSKVSIKHSDIPDFSSTTFKVIGRDSKEFKFILYYKIVHDGGTLNAYYCGNSRTVCEFSEKDFKISLPYGYSGYLLLESTYLDDHVNNDRNEFDIFPIRTDFVSPLSWEQINTELKLAIGKIVNESIKDAEVINKERIKSIQEERPYLVEYIDEADLEMAGFIDKKIVIDKAKKKFDAAKENFLANKGKANYTEKELDEAIQITQNELVSYIYDRVQVLERLKTMIDDKEKVEAIIHNLFMKKYTEDDYYSIGKNNLWLFDDRFTTYSYAASDKRIKDVLTQVGEELGADEIGTDKPDLSLFFSHNPTQPERLKSVLIEIKPFDYTNKPDRKKFQGIQQLVDYVKAFKNKERIEEIWAFLLTDVDEKLAERLRGDDYTPLFSTDTPTYHRFYKDLGISIYVINAKTLILDAEARNKIFLDIIRKKNRLNQMLNS